MLAHVFCCFLGMLSGGGVIVLESKRRDLQAYPETRRVEVYEKTANNIIKCMAVFAVLVMLVKIEMFFISI